MKEEGRKGGMEAKRLEEGRKGRRKTRGKGGKEG